MVYLTADTHGDFSQIIYFSKLMNTKKRDVMVILGDAGVNYHLNERDEKKKRKLASLNLTILCIHGSHEQRPNAIGSYRQKKWRGGRVYVESEYPNILFAIDGEIYNLNGKKAMVIGGSYSEDKELRLRKNHVWFDNEQPSEKVKRKVERRLEKRKWKIDVFLTHTIPLKYEPEEIELMECCKDNVDRTTEVWLDYIEERTDYQKWYCGHYHTKKIINKVQILYEEFEKLER